jgi:hypothetical protein
MMSVPNIDKIVEIYMKNKQHFQISASTPQISLLYGGQNSQWDFHKTGFNYCWLKNLLERTGSHSIE